MGMCYSQCHAAFMFIKDVILFKGLKENCIFLLCIADLTQTSYSVRIKYEKTFSHSGQ